MRQMEALLLETLQGLISIDTTNPPGNEAAAARYLAGVLEKLGFETEIFPLSENRANLVATLRFGPGPTLALCGHLDVVAADPSRWQGDPFALREEGGRYYGRGTCDMKGGICAMVAAAKRVVGNTGLCGALQLVFVADEELYTAGTFAYLETCEKPDMVVIGEPTGMDVCVAHRGVSRYSLTFVGKSGHAANPAKAQNPIYDAARFALTAQRKNEELAGVRHEILPPPTLAVTIFEGGEQSNSVPGTCKVIVDRRTLPGEDAGAIATEAEEILQRAALEGEAPAPQFFVQTPASQPLPGSTLGQRCQQVLREMGHNAKIRDFGACCDQFAFIRQGVDCVLVGPGSLEQAHTANEYVEAEQLGLAAEFYEQLILEELKRRS